jgi:hypothetical protein
VGLLVLYNVRDHNAGSSNDPAMRQINATVNYWPIPDVVFKFEVQPQDNGSAENDSVFNVGTGYPF